jgi:intracellular sulfur oxidation DsrE/DsrF family protein
MSASDTIILVTNNGMGKADLPLQQKLFGKYLELLAQNDELPAVICFYTEGVKLVVEGSPVLEPLRLLEEKGVRLVVCSTCLEYFKLSEKVQVGIVGGMPDILEAQMKVGKVITL